MQSAVLGAAWLSHELREANKCIHPFSSLSRVYRAVYIRSPHGHDLGKVLKSVVFTLHPSFNNHIRGAHQSID